MFKFLKNIQYRKKNQTIEQENNVQTDSCTKSWDKEEQTFHAEELWEIPIIEVAPTNPTQISRGTKERFSSNLTYNITKLKERAASSQLILEEIKVGSSLEKKLTICYLKDRANPDIVNEIKARIKAIRAEGILDSSYIERNIEDSSISPFPQIEVTERPDVAESALTQGRVVIILDGSPDILLAPATFFDLMDTPEDTFRRWFIASSFFRIARYIMFIFAVSLPALYISLRSFNPELIPTRLLGIILANQIEKPFPIYFEAFLLMGIIEAVRMMMLRMPTQLGSTIALFAGLVLMGAGIAGNIIGVPIVIVVTLTIISSYGIPNNDLRSSVRIIQFFTMLMTSFFGLFGFAAAFFYLAIHLVTLKSFGIPYMTPLAPLEKGAWGHTIFRENTKEMSEDLSYKPQRTTKKGEKSYSSGGNQKNQDKLDPRVLGIVVVVAVLEFELFTFTKTIVDIAAQDAWLSVILGSLIAIITSILFVRLASRFPNENFFEYSKKIWGKPLSILIILTFISFWFLYGATLLQDMRVINKLLFLPKTPSLIPLLILITAAVWLVSYGIAALVRFFQLLLPFIFIPVIALPLLSIRTIEWQHFLPVLSNGLLPVLKGALVFAGAIQGLEVILFISPFLSDIRKSYLPVIIGISSLMFLIFTFLISSVGVLGVENVKQTIWPGINTVSIIELPGFPVERFELFLTLPGLLGIFTTLCIYLYLISYGIIGLTNFKYRKLIITLVGGVIISGVYLFPNYAWAINMRNVVQYLTLVIFAIANLTLVMAIIRGKGVSR